MSIFRQNFSNTRDIDSESRKINWSTICVMLISMIAASVLNVFPVYELLANLRPLFLFTVMLFWVVHRPEIFGITFVFIVGIISDFLLDTRLGQQAFSAVIAIFFMQYTTKEMNRINDITLWFFAAVTIVVFNITLLVLQFLDGQVIIWRNGLPMFTSILMWPAVVFFLKRF